MRVRCASKNDEELYIADEFTRNRLVKLVVEEDFGDRVVMFLDESKLLIIKNHIEWLLKNG